MSINAGIFGDTPNLKERYILDQSKLRDLVKFWKGMGLKIVLTSGTWDLFHVGHAQYLEQAKKMGDLLIVGVDSDEKVKKRKGPHRPVVPQEERVAILSHIRHVDVITLKKVSDPKDNLIKIVRPDVLVVSESTGHKDRSVKKKQNYCGKLVVLSAQSKTSTTAKVRLMHVTGASQLAKSLVPKTVSLIKKQAKKDPVKFIKNLPEVLSEMVGGVINDIQKGYKK